MRRQIRLLSLILLLTISYAWTIDAGESDASSEIAASNQPKTIAPLQKESKEALKGSLEHWMSENLNTFIGFCCLLVATSTFIIPIALRRKSGALEDALKAKDSAIAAKDSAISAIEAALKAKEATIQLFKFQADSLSSIKAEYDEYRHQKEIQSTTNDRTILNLHEQISKLHKQVNELEAKNLFEIDPISNAVVLKDSIIKGEKEE